jgi:pteridine reductase
MQPLSDLPLKDRTILITGAAKRIGRSLARACANAGADIVVHYHRSTGDAEEAAEEIRGMGRRAWLVEGDLGSEAGVHQIITGAFQAGPVYALVNNAAIFEPVSMQETTPESWHRHMQVNLAAPFFLSKAFARQIPQDGGGRIVNMVDWRALRPGPDHFPYTISKAALASMTHAMAAALAPNISVNALALGAILPPTDKPPSADILNSVPAGRWGELPEVEAALIFLLSGPAYITGEIIHVDGGRHLV